MSQTKTGLQKDVSEIFNGVSPQKDSGDFTPPKEEKSVPEHQDNAASKSSVPSHMTPTKPKHRESSQQKADLLQKFKANAVGKAIGKILEHKAIQNIKDKLLAPKEGVSDKRQKVTIALVPVLFLVLIVMFIRVFSSPSGKASSPTPSGPTQTTADAEDKINWEIPKPYPTTIRDPMQFGSTTGNSGGLIVKGILYSKDNPSAIIGNHIVHEGDKIMDVTIAKINNDSVEFQTNDKKWIQKVER